MKACTWIKTRMLVRIKNCKQKIVLYIQVAPGTEPYQYSLVREFSIPLFCLFFNWTEYYNILQYASTARLLI